MPCSGQYNFFYNTESIRYFAAKNLQNNPDYTGGKVVFVFIKVFGSFLQMLTQTLVNFRESALRISRAATDAAGRNAILT